MILWLVQQCHAAIERIIVSTLTTLIYFIAFLALAHVFGWIERYIWWSLEREASKILNGALVTLGSFRIDWSEILQGKITLHASNVVLHTPRREEWQWESPLIGRVGKAIVSCNAPITIFHFVFFRQELPIEVYSVQAWDIQVFVERRDNIFNVYMCDPSLLLPPPPPLEQQTRSTLQEEKDEEFFDSHQQEVGAHKQQAQQLVNDMITAVQTAGRATRKGKSWQSVVKEQRLGLADKLRDMKNYKEGVKVMREVGQVAVKSFNEAPKRLEPPKKRQGHVMKPVYARVGRIVLSDIRIFTKDSFVRVTSTQLNDTSGWSKPIFLETLLVRASEMSPPISATDSDDLPAVYQNVDKILEIAWRRLLAEMAKSNSGKLFSTAIGEVLSVMKKPAPEVRV